VATGMGMNASIVSQSTLYDTTLLSGTDALIVSSGVITLTSSQITAITQFMQSGRSLYLQGEYDCSIYNTNTTFESLVNDNGGSLTLNGTIAGTLAPMTVLGTLGTTPNTVSPLDYFWYGCRANACAAVEPFLQYGPDYFGFIFCPPQSSYGKVVFTSDQDWINQSTSIPLMDNILALLTSGTYQCSGTNFFGVSLGNDTSLCPGSSLTLNAGSSGFTYLWSTGSTDTSIVVNSAGTYWLTVDNGSCEVSDTIILTDTLCNPIIFNSTDTDICQKFCIDFYDSSQNNPTAWQWFFEGASPASSTAQNPTNICYNLPGTYDVTLITTSTTGNDTLTLSNYITVYNTPAFPSITQNGYDLTSSVATSYQWQLNSTDIPGATDQTYSMTQTGFYTVVVYDENGCKNSTSLYVTISGIDELNVDANVAIYPNPATETVIVEFLNGWKSEGVSISMVNAIGQQVFSFEQSLTYEGWKKEISLANISDGVYFITIRTQDELMVKKITVAK
jgi:PKD repeat protein